MVKFWPFGREKQPVELELDTEDVEQVSTEPLIDYMDWGIRLGTMGKSDRAAEQFRRVLDKEPDDPLAHYNLALALDESGDHIAACRHYERAMQLAPDSVDVCINFGASLLASGEAAAAIEHLKHAARVSPDDPLPHFNLGCAYLALNDCKKAIASFRQALSLDPKDARIRFNLAVALRKSGSPDLAENELREFLALAGERYPKHKKFVQRLL